MRTYRLRFGNIYRYFNIVFSLLFNLKLLVIAFYCYVNSVGVINDFSIVIFVPILCVINLCVKGCFWVKTINERKKRMKPYTKNKIDKKYKFFNKIFFIAIGGELIAKPCQFNCQLIENSSQKVSAKLCVGLRQTPFVRAYDFFFFGERMKEILMS